MKLGVLHNLSSHPYNVAHTESSWSRSRLSMGCTIWVTDSMVNAINYAALLISLTTLLALGSTSHVTDYPHGTIQGRNHKHIEGKKTIRTQQMLHIDNCIIKWAVFLQQSATRNSLSEK